MKRLPVVTKEQSEGFAKVSGHDYWRTPEDRAGSLAFRAQQAREFVDDEHEPPPGVDRRSFVKLMGASMAMAGLAACRRPEEKILPYAHAPEDLIPGRPEHYATSVAWAGTAVGLLVESHEGRPTKIEGNPQHPDSLGATNAFHQALVLDLYDPDRSNAPQTAGKPTSWADADAALAALATEARGNAGENLAIIVQDHRSPTTKRALEALLRDMPKARIVAWEPFGRDNAREGARLAFGAPADAVLDFSKARVVLTLDANPLGADGSSVKHLRGWATRRRAEAGEMSRVYAVESTPSETGFAADHRLRLPSRKIVAFAGAVATALGLPGGTKGDLDENAKKLAAVVAKDLALRGTESLVVAGRRQPPALHALVAAINDKLGAVGTTVRYVPLVDDVPSGAGALAGLLAPTEGQKEVKTVLILGGNPVFDGPAGVDLKGLLARTKSVHLATHVDETGSVCTWHIPRAHALEGWADTMAEDGTPSVTQPLIAPMYDGKTDAELLEHFVGGTRSAYDLVRATWAGMFGGLTMPSGAGFEKAWRRVVHDGLQLGVALAPMPTSIDFAGIGKALGALAVPEGAVEVTFSPDSHAWDGRFANSGWLQELPDPIQKMCWVNAAAISPATAKKLGVESGDHVTVSVGGAAVELPCVITFGQADDSVAVTSGQGRKVVGRVGSGVGFDTYPLRRNGVDIVGGTLAKAAGNTKLPITQGHFSLDGRPLIREQTLEEHDKEPNWAKELVEFPPEISLFEGYEYNGHKWAMAIDLSLCTGCGTCVTACQAENNTTIVGPEGVLRNREMHWMRIDRYFEGSEDEPRSVVQPMLCQHCENAPCEQVCPVNATTHSPEGINEMTYNRCIGTKYCGNNCPYKVRRFNYFAYTKDMPGTTALAMNPDVTVRSRGVMEKCSFCVQRVNEAKIAAKTQEGRVRLHDGEARSACEQVCPTGAIVFGDLNDPKSRVAKAVDLPRSYKILQELNVRPRVNYLARITNPNPELAKA